MKNGLLWCFKACVAALVSLVILSLFTLLYSHTGVHITNKSGATDYKWETYQFRANMTEGFSWFSMNGDGFNNSFDLEDVSQIDVLLMGSSHMEAVNVPQKQNCAYLLNQLLFPKVTYNIGTSGHTIYHCLKNMKDAVAYYNPSEYVVVETDRVDLDEEEMLRVLNDELSDIPSHDTGIIYIVQKCVPCFLPLYRDLSNWINGRQLLWQRTARKATPEEKKDYAHYSKTLDDFMAKMAEYSDGRKVIIVYQPATVLGEDGCLIENKTESTEIFSEACNQHGIIFINMFDDFNLAYENGGTLAHGFINTAVGSGHLNVTGHKLMAERISSVIKEHPYGAE